MGPPRETVEAFNTFQKDIQEHCGLTLQLGKCELYSLKGEKPTGCSQEVSLGGASVDGKWEPGFICVGVPIGLDPYVKEMMRRKLVDLEEEVVRASRVLGEERHSLWTILRYIT